MTVNVNGDTANEPNETFFLNVTNVVGTGVVVVDGTGAGTIVNDDFPAVAVYTIQGSGNARRWWARSWPDRHRPGVRPRLLHQDVAGAGTPTRPTEFRLTSSAPPAAAAVGNGVQVTGTVASSSRRRIR